MANVHPGNGWVCFGAFELDLRAGELRKHGIKIKLQEQPFQVLQVLLEKPGEIVTRKELQRRLWPSDTFVEFDKGIYNAIKRLRETLSDDAETPRYIETLPRRGYRFVGAVNGAGGDRLRAPSNALPVASQLASPRVKLAVTAIGATLLLAVALGFRHWRVDRNDRSSAPDLKLIKLTANPSEIPVDYAAISPDGKLIAYTDASGIHVKNIETDEFKLIPPPVDPQVQMSPADSDARLPVSWFPDGARLLVSTKPGPTMWSVSLLTGQAQKLRDGGWASSVSPDGSLIAFVAKDREIWVMGPRGEQPRALAVAESGTAFGRVIWSPDSGRIAYTKIYYKQHALECAIEGRSLEGGPPTVVLSDTRLCQPQAQSFWWSREGRIIFPLAEPESASHEFNLWEIQTDTKTGKPLGRARRLTNWAGFYLGGITGTSDGKRLAFLRTSFRGTIHIAEIDSNRPGHLNITRHLMPEEHSGWPTAWTPDSRAVVFYRTYGGNNDIFKQDVDKDIAVPLVKGPGEQLTARLSPDGLWFIYMDVTSFQNFGPSTPVRLMRIPTAGGPSELLLISHGYDGHRCSRLPATVCVLGERSPDEKRLVFYAFDPAQDSASSGAIGGTKRELLTIDAEPRRTYGWDLSPDGSYLAIASPDEHAIPIRFVSLTGGPSFEVTIKRWGNQNSMDWSADGRSIFISSRSSSGETLLQVDLQGRAHVLWQQKGGFQTWAIPSPDGRRLAVFTATKDCDVWMAENF